MIIILMNTIHSSAQSPASDLLRAKLSDIVILREKIAEKKHQVVDIFNQLKEQEKVLVKEIIKEQNQAGLVSYETVHQCPRIYYDIKLIRQLKAYIEKIEEKIIFFQLSDEKLIFLYQQADDDLKIIQALNNIKVNDLIERINILTVHINAEIDKKFINTDELVFGTQEALWDEIYLQINNKSRIVFQ